VSSLGPVRDRAAPDQEPGYDPLKDFDYITVAVQAPNVLAVPASSPHKSLADVLAFTRRTRQDDASPRAATARATT
jgi:tripartite-type tricarboxylate transporter receptor subunit TctC